MKSRPDSRFERFEFASVVGTPPYAFGPIRSRSGLKRTAFYPTTSQFSGNYKLHNTYLKPDYFTDPIEEYWAVRKIAGLFDVTGEEILEITGRDAQALLDSLMPRDVRKMKSGQCYYSVLCHDHGGIVEDGILAKYSDDHFWWIGGPGNSEEWLYANSIGHDVKIESFNDRIHVASLQGPKSREILQAVCSKDLSDVPFYGLLTAKICGVDVTLTRTGYTAELGFDIYVDVAHGAAFFADLWAIVEKNGGLLCGSRALGIRRIEASILNFGQDFDWQHTPVEIGLGWMISETKAPYRAQAALQAAKATPAQQHIVGLKFTGNEVPLIGDVLLVDDVKAGQITSATGSPTLGYPIAIALIEFKSKIGDKVSIDAGGTLLTAEIVAMPFFDPERKLSKI